MELCRHKLRKYVIRVDRYGTAKVTSTWQQRATVHQEWSLYSRSAGGAAQTLCLGIRVVGLIDGEPARRAICSRTGSTDGVGIHPYVVFRLNRATPPSRVRCHPRRPRRAQGVTVASRTHETGVGAFPF